jgi:hypothetical protein
MECVVVVKSLLEFYSYYIKIWMGCGGALKTQIYHKSNLNTDDSELDFSNRNFLDIYIYIYV